MNIERSVVSTFGLLRAYEHEKKTYRPSAGRLTPIAGTSRGIRRAGEYGNGPLVNWATITLLESCPKRKPARCAVRSIVA